MKTGKGKTDHSGSARTQSALARRSGSRVVQPDGWPRPRGYANAIAARGRAVFVAGQIGWDPVAERVESDDFAAQARRALENVVAVLRAGGADPSDVVRLTWYVTDRAAYAAARRDVGTAYRQLFGAHFPAMSVVVVAGLLDERAQVEIEATAIVADRAT